jgi:serine/threonine protein kinase
MIYEMATGRLPFAGASPFETVTNVLDKNPVPLNDLAPQRPAALGSIVTRLLAKQLDQRYASADDLIAELSRVTTGGGNPLRRAFKRLQSRRSPILRDRYTDGTVLRSRGGSGGHVIRICSVYSSL